VPPPQFYEFQPSLAIVTRTIVVAIPDLFHFLIIFLTFLVMPWLVAQPTGDVPVTLVISA
jgi:hypothetical protein